jgi:hypothetical protein
MMCFSFRTADRTAHDSAHEGAEDSSLRINAALFCEVFYLVCPEPVLVK